MIALVKPMGPLARGAALALVCAAGCTSFGTSNEPTPATDASVEPPVARDAAMPPVDDAATADSGAPVADAASSCTLHEDLDFSSLTSFDTPTWKRDVPLPDRVRIEREASAQNLRSYTLDETSPDAYAVALHHVPYVAKRITRLSFDVGRIKATTGVSFVVAQLLGLVGDGKNVAVVWRSGQLQFFTSGETIPFASATVDADAMSRVRLDLDVSAGTISAVVNDTPRGLTNGALTSTPAPMDVGGNPGATLQLGLFFPYRDSLAPRSPSTEAVYDNVRVEHCP